MIVRDEVPPAFVVGGTVSSVRRSAAEETEIVLQEGARSGTPVMIPGSFEARPDRSIASLTDGAPQVTHRVPRSAVPQRTVFERIWRYIMRPTDTPPI